MRAKQLKELLKDIDDEAEVLVVDEGGNDDTIAMISVESAGYVEVGEAVDSVGNPVDDDPLEGRKIFGIFPIGYE